MSRQIFAVLIFIAGFFPVFAPNLHGFQDKAPYREGEVLVQFHEGTAPGTISALHGSVQGKIRRHLPERAQLVELPPHIPVEKALGIYRANSRVKHVEPNYIVQRALTPNDQLFGRQWHLENTGQNYSGSQNRPQRGTAGADIGAPEAWDIHTGSNPIIVAVLDSGVDYLHPDLAANMVGGWNFIAGHNDPMDDDPSSHGTHVAGIIGAVGNNGIGVSGVSWTVRLMPLKTLGGNGSGTIADAVAAIDYAVANGARVINASYGQSSAPSTFERQAIERAGSAGILFVAAAGNSGSNNDTTPFYPASYPLPNIISVAATDAHDELASFSNYGATSVHLAAPGQPILSTLHRERGEYGFLSGTSMAAPMVSGAAALLMSFDPELSMQEVRQLLLESAYVYPALTGKVIYGRLDAGEALFFASSDLPPAPTGLEIISRSFDHLEIAWGIRPGFAGSFELERRIGSGNFETLVTLPSTILHYRDEGASDREGSAFSYRVRATTGAGASVWSNEAGILIPPLEPQNLQADLDQGGILLSWEDHSQVESGYEIERRLGGGAFQKIVDLPEDSIDYFDGGVEGGKTYSYRVRAVHALTGPSDYSQEVTVAVPGSSSLHGDSASIPVGKGGGGGCFIATAAFGSDLHPRVAVLRQFRDEVLLSNRWGRMFNELYLRLSPPLASRIAKSETLRSVVRAALTPVFFAVEWWMGGGEEEDRINQSPRASAAFSGE